MSENANLAQNEIMRLQTTIKILDEEKKDILTKN
jgi:hypothetical protein